MIFENLNVYKACWISIEKSKNNEVEEFKRVKQKFLAKDNKEQLVFLADSDFTLQMTKNKYPSIKFYFTSEYK